MSGIGEYACVSGDFVPADEAKVPAFDRGFLFAHAAYEVTAVYSTRIVDSPAHYQRLLSTLEALEIPSPFRDFENYEGFNDALISHNKLTEGLIYLQVTGGDYGLRDFYGPETFEPNFFMFTTAKPLIGETARDGVKAIFAEDTRWKRRGWKTTQLVSQTQVYRAARAAGAHMAWMHEDGMITEAASANAWIVRDGGVLVTRDLSHALLPGITRQSVKNLLEKNGLAVEERAFSVDEARQAREAFTTSTGVVIAPVTAFDGQPVGDGRPGVVTRKVQRLYYDYIGADVAAVAPWALA